MEAGGFTKDASRDQVRILRQTAGTTGRAEIDIDMKRVFEGKANDFPLQPNDALGGLRASVRAILAQNGTSLLTSLPYLAITIATVLR